MRTSVDRIRAALARSWFCALSCATLVAAAAVPLTRVSAQQACRITVRDSAVADIAAAAMALGESPETLLATVIGLRCELAGGTVRTPPVEVVQAGLPHRPVYRVANCTRPRTRARHDAVDAHAVLIWRVRLSRVPASAKPGDGTWQLLEMETHSVSPYFGRERIAWDRPTGSRDAWVLVRYAREGVGT
jgi:hypothetical protein